MGFNMRRVAVAVVALALGSVAGWLVSDSVTGSPAPTVLDGLAAPRGLSPTSDGELLVAEGGAGRLLRWGLSGEAEVLSDEFPRLSVSGIEGESASGISAAIESGGTYYAVVGEARAKGHQELYRLVPPGPPIGVTGQDVLGAFPPRPIANPYDLVQHASGDLLVSDSGRNSILRISPGGEITDYALFDSRDVPVVDGVMDVVPTGVTWGPDGALYVASLTGYPYPTGEAYVYRIDDANGDGDAMDEGEVTVFAGGFTAATDLAFDADGSLLVTEFSVAMAELVTELTAERAAQLPGRLVRRHLDGTLEVVAEGLAGPTAVAVLEGRIFVSEEFAGRVAEISQDAPGGRSPLVWVSSAAGGVIGAAASVVALWWLARRRPAS